MSNRGKSELQINILDANLRKQQTPSANFKLGWSHYQILVRIENDAARRFYEIESVRQQWSVRQLRRQVGSSLYERLGLSRDKDKVTAHNFPVSDNANYFILRFSFLD